MCVTPRIDAAPQKPPEPDPGVAHVRSLLDQGAYADAEREATDLAARAGAANTIDAGMLPASLLDLFVEARVANGKATDSTTLELARRAVALAASGESRHQDLAGALHTLGSVHFELGEFKEALAQHERALGIRRRASADPQALADSLDLCSIAEIRLGRYTAARQRIDEALATREARASTVPLALARTLELQAIWLRYTGDFSHAVTVLDRVLTLRSTKAAQPVVTTTWLNVRGDVLFLTGDVRSARQAWSEGLALAERTLDPQHPQLALFLRKLALAADAFGDRSGSRALIARATALGLRRLPPCHPEALGLINDSALSAERDGDYAGARNLFRQHLQTLETCGANADWTATALHNLGGIAVKMGDLIEAERLHALAVKVWTEGLGPRHAHVARGLDALAEVVALRGQLSRARDMYEQALAIRRGISRAENPDVAWTLTNLAGTLEGLGQLNSALRQVEEAISIYRRQGVFEEPDHLARALALKGTIEARRGDLGAARASLAASLEERERIFGNDHPLLAESGAALARVQFLGGAGASALATALTAERIGRDHLRFTIRYLPERLALAYAVRRPAALDLLLSIAASSTPLDPHAVFDALVRSRAVVLDELAARARMTDTGDPRTAELMSNVRRTRQRFANLVVRSMQERVPLPVLDDARRESEAAEQMLAQASGNTRIDSVGDRIGLSQLQALMTDSDAMVSFVKFNRTRVTSGGTTSGQPSYGAFVLNRGALRFIPLGSAAVLERLIDTWRHEVSGRSIAAGVPLGQAESAYRVAATRLRKAAWDPMAGYLAGAIRVFIVPDGLLNVVNFAALPTDGTGYLIEHGPLLHYLSAERDFAASASPTDLGRGLLAIGGPAFKETALSSTGQRIRAPGAQPPSASSAGEGMTATTDGTRNGGGNCDAYRSLNFRPLPGTAEEVAEVRRTWDQVAGSASASSGEARSLTGINATEHAVKQFTTGTRVLHLATHGFFLGNCALGPTDTRAVGGLVTSPHQRPRVRRSIEPWDNPLLLSGLAFAGANRRGAAGPDDEDGILTAEEVASLDLRGVEWAVLSACGTGLGEIRAGEGVLGLRRAFQIAGARTVIMSLWSVDDRATKDWMRTLYEARLGRHLSTVEAVRAAGVGMLQSRRAAGQSTHPFYWAAFVAAGDWR